MIYGNPIIVNSAQPSSGYYVVWLNWDDTVLSVQTYEAGQTPSYPSGTPTRPDSSVRSYTFTGWEPAITAVTSDVAYKAQYTSTLVGAIEFSSALPFSVSKPMNWDGTTEYLVNGTTWTTWDGSSVSSTPTGTNYVLYLRGTGNTYFSGSTNSDGMKFVSSGTISISGNIENLLDYQTVANNQHPSMAERCFQYLFMGCTNLSSVDPDFLSATSLSNYCYYYMFNGCSGLTQLPRLPAASLAQYCYANMFQSCSGLIEISAGQLPATTLATHCYDRMFANCSNLVTVPSTLLPATTLATYCYSYMFLSCTSLVSLPAGFLPATTMQSYCYESMFRSCSGLTTLPNGLLSSTTLATYCYRYMFYGCTLLADLPTLAATSLKTSCYQYMFGNCSVIELSTTQVDDYQTPYRIPSSGTGTTASNALANTFNGTGGTFTGTPTINTTYYTSNTVRT